MFLFVGVKLLAASSEAATTAIFTAKTIAVTIVRSIFVLFEPNLSVKLRVPAHNLEVFFTEENFLAFSFLENASYTELLV